ncbi:hypothetical protein BV22DRAFT_1051557 [Leucogyrophana mollusca]|uniref:Uncharacterized protein n=1 Tax=Leucogyrophana mollusca TaxID=85980 RepID=A0ACB8AZ76_9AGAM|nr:hypothetical protein BV22DRAFT_1051557 [Leucogyrophana mollusca]
MSGSTSSYPKPGYGLGMITPEDATIVKIPIANEADQCESLAHANKRNGIDVDKSFAWLVVLALIVFLRDVIPWEREGIGRPPGECDIAVLGRFRSTSLWLIHSARIIEDQICYGIKEPDANQGYELCYTRLSFHKRIYSHKTATTCEYMIIDALPAAEPIMSFAGQVANPENHQMVGTPSCS